MHVWRVGLFVLPGRRFGLSAMPTAMSWKPSAAPKTTAPASGALGPWNAPDAGGLGPEQ